MASVSLSLLVLKTHQIDDLRKFYGCLGIELREEQHGNGPLHYAARVGDVVLEIYPLVEDGALVDTTTRLGFVVENVNEVIERLQALGVAVVAQPQMTKWGFRAVVRDPDGHSVELSQR